MRMWNVIVKSFREQVRSYWLLLLTVITAPFFVVVYRLITESYQPSYDVVIYNADRGGMTATGPAVNFGDSLDLSFRSSTAHGMKVSSSSDTASVLQQIRNNRADLLLIVPEHFSTFLLSAREGMVQESLQVEFFGNMSDVSYLISAILAYNHLAAFIERTGGVIPPFELTETGVGMKGTRSDFELAVPGLMIFAIIMLMLTASVAMVSEVENKTIYRLRLSNASVFELMGGIAAVQVLVALCAVILTLAVAAALGYRFEGALLPVFVIVMLTAISVIFFSLFIAAFSKTATQVLIIGNFPLFIFMFFTGSMFPVNPPPWITLMGYDLSVISLLSPSHAVSALNKIMGMQLGFRDVLPEILCLCMVSGIYLAGGLALYKKRHLS